MWTCPSCGEEVDDAAAKCPRCLAYSEEVLLRLVRDPASEIRQQAVDDMTFLVANNSIVRALATALHDSEVAVRRAAGLELFICGAKAELATDALIAALDDVDLIVRRLAAGALSMIGPPAQRALPRLAQLRDSADDTLRIWVAEAEERIGGGRAEE